MRKTVFAALVLALCLAMLVGCNMNDKAQSQITGVDNIATKYVRTSDATKIEQTISIKLDQTETYSLQKTLVKTQNGYDVTETERSLNKVEVDNVPEQQYAQTQKTYSLEKAANAVARLSLKREYFEEEGLEFTLNSLKGEVKSGSERALLSIDDPLPAKVERLKVDIAADNDHVTTIKMNYSSQGYTVEISLIYTYAALGE